MAEAALPSPFTNASIQFLQELAANNNREWFAQHKQVYEQAVQVPMRQLVAKIAPAMLDIDPELEVNPRYGAISRVVRDVRFSKDKSPYRVNQWIALKRPEQDWSTRPAFFMEFSPEGYRYGMGSYAATAASMRAVRDHIESAPGKYLQAMEQARQAGYAVEGERYKRPRLPEGQPDLILEWYRRKNIYVVINKPLDADFFSPKFAALLEKAFAAAAPLYHLLLIAKANEQSPQEKEAKTEKEAAW